LLGSIPVRPSPPLTFIKKELVEASVVAVLTTDLTNDINAGTGHKTSESGPVCGSGVSCCFLSLVFVSHLVKAYSNVNMTLKLA
jgi:hypothetical protein